MKIIAMIPARLSSSRFNRKLMMDLCGKPIIVRTYESVLSTKLFCDVYVVTEDQEIYDLIISIGGKSILSKKNYVSGSDRIAEASRGIESDLIVNVQGDEPFIDKDSLSKLIKVFENNVKIEFASLMIKITDYKEVDDPNNVKVIVDKENNAIYFSRSRIPYSNKDNNDYYFKHIGVYAFKNNALFRFANTPISTLENKESIEAIRIVENGWKMKMVESHFIGIGIDIEEDLERARIKWNIDNCS